MKTNNRRRKAIIRRRLFLGLCALLLALVICLVVFIVSALLPDGDDNISSEPQSSVSSTTSDQNPSSDTNSSSSEVSSTNPSSSDPSSSETSSQTSDISSTVSNVDASVLDPDYSNLLLVNGENPLPEDYDYGGHLTTIPDKYINGSLKQIDKDVWPYMKAMIEAAWSDGVNLYVWSPYRSYATQNMLYENQVTRCMNKGLDRSAAEIEAATVVARPGTSEHNTGLAADFNMASDKFETTAMYIWMLENAEDYGFILRYEAEKQPLTGVIHESWHWRFVGINAAKEMNDLGYCLEEYVEYLNNSTTEQTEG